MAVKETTRSAQAQMSTLPERVAVVETKVDAMIVCIESIKDSQKDIRADVKDMHDCLDNTRDRTQLCVIETPADQSAIERTGTYRGLYFVLMGKLSPLDGIGPHDIGLAKLKARVGDGVLTEVILATNFTAEGEATAHVISEMIRQQGVKVTRLARGVPAGSELEYVDLGTIAHALVDRR